MTIYNRTFPFKKGYTPKASEDSCKYCVHGVIHKPFINNLKRSEWVCGKTCGDFKNNNPDYCGHYSSLDDAKSGINTKYIIKTQEDK